MTQTSSVANGDAVNVESELIADRYRNLGELGGGGMAVVYQVVSLARWSANAGEVDGQGADARKVRGNTEL